MQAPTTYGHAPVFESGLVQLRPLAAPRSQRIKPHPFAIANALVQPSYISCQSVLAYYGLIPEYVPKLISLTTRQLARYKTLTGTYIFHHIVPAMFFGYQRTKLERGQQAFVATPEKALLDLIYLTPDGDNPAYLRSLRLQEMEQLDLSLLQQLALRMQSPKLQRAAEYVIELAIAEATEYETL